MTDKQDGRHLFLHLGHPEETAKTPSAAEGAVTPRECDPPAPQCSPLLLLPADDPLSRADDIKNELLQAFFDKFPEAVPLYESLPSVCVQQCGDESDGPVWTVAQDVVAGVPSSDGSYRDYFSYLGVSLNKCRVGSPCSDSSLVAMRASVASDLSDTEAVDDRSPEAQVWEDDDKTTKQRATSLVESDGLKPQHAEFGVSV